MLWQVLCESCRWFGDKLIPFIDWFGAKRGMLEAHHTLSMVQSPEASTGGSCPLLDCEQ